MSILSQSVLFFFCGWICWFVLGQFTTIRLYEPNSKLLKSGEVIPENFETLADIPSLFRALIRFVLAQYYKFDYEKFVKIFYSKGNEKEQLMLPKLTVNMGPLRVDIKFFRDYYKALALNQKEIDNGVDEYAVFALFEAIYIRMFFFLASLKLFPFRMVGAIHFESVSTVSRVVRSEVFYDDKSENALRWSNTRFSFKSELLPEWKFTDKKDITFSVKNSTFIFEEFDKYDANPDADPSGKPKLVSETVNTYLIRAPKKIRGKGDSSGSDEDSSEDKSKRVVWPKISGSKSREFAFLTGDVNPIHLWPQTASLFGMRSNIMHGIWSIGRIASAIISHRIAYESAVKQAVNDASSQSSGKYKSKSVPVSSVLSCDNFTFTTSFIRPLFLPNDKVELSLSAKEMALDTAEQVSFELFADANGKGSSKAVIRGSVDFNSDTG